MQSALAVTKVAILLISANFLASDFLDENVIIPLLHAAENGGAIIVPVIILPCFFEGTPLHQFQAFNTEPLSKKNTNDQHEVWVGLVRYVLTLMKSPE